MRNRIFFASDTHFWHTKLVEGGGDEFDSPRPFATIEEHNEKLIENWNSVVKPQDTVWHLGDVLLSGNDFTVLGRLNGNIKLILGNHDTPAKIEEYKKYFSRIEAYGTVGKSVVLSHIPVHPRELNDRWKVNIHGHLHDAEVGDPRYFCVSMERINYTPISWEEIKEKLTERGVI